MTEKTQQLLLVDDDAELAEMLHEFLELQGFEVVVVDNGESALQVIPELEPDLVILDVMLPGISGFEVLSQLRTSQDVPIIMLTARGEESDRILGLTHGADDYLAKPFNPLELVARINAILKRSMRGDSKVVDELVAGPISLSLLRRELTVNNELVLITAAEMRVLEQLLSHPDEVLSRAQLTEMALDRPLEAYDRSIDTLISKLRGKLSAAGVSKKCIRGLRGHGYVLDSEALRSD
jgi:two-component system response regulator CpxR